VNEPSDDLTGHLVSGVCKVSCETKVGEFELPVGGDEQVIWLQILRSSRVPSATRRLTPNAGCALRRMVKKDGTHPVKNEIPMAELQSTKGHRHPRLDVRRQKDEGAILDDDLEVAIQELEDEIEVRFRGKDVHELAVGWASWKKKKGYEETGLPR
jgi:hypothetical protein